MFQSARRLVAPCFARAATGVQNAGNLFFGEIACNNCTRSAKALVAMRKKDACRHLDNCVGIIADQMHTLLF